MSGIKFGTTRDSAIADISVDGDSAIFDEEASLTHPRGYSSDHIEGLDIFAEDLNQALRTSFPSRSNPYTAVYALLFRWAEDDLGVQYEISALRKVFETRFHYNVEEWQIPSVNSTRALQKKLYGFQDAHQSETELLIVYYGGHAKADYRRGRSIWQAHRQPDSPFLNWSSLQPLLETAVPYVLIILDCCFAATAARDTTEGTTKEILAACGRESPTHGVGQRSFTSALIEEMQAFEEGEYFTAAMLHSRLVTMRWRLAFTPIYALLSEHGGNSITICPFSDGRASVRPASILAELEATGDPREEQGSMTMDDSPSPQISQKPAADTRVLLSVSVVQDAVHDVSQWVSWLTTRAPWDVTKVNVQVHSIFKSHSTLIIVSVPTCAWNRLPERPAYRFIGFIRSGDDFQAAKCSTAAITETIPFAVDEMKMPKPVDAARAMIYPSKSQSGFQTETEAQSISQRHKRQRANMVDRPTAKVWRRSPRFSVSGASRSPKKTPESGFCSQKPRPVWPPENEERDRADNIKMEGFEKAYIDRLLLRVQPHPGRHIYPIN